MKYWLILSFILHDVHTIQVGMISNVFLSLPSISSSVTVMNGTSQECVCVMISSTNISAFNSFSNNTCEFFSNLSLTHVNYSWMIDRNSTFYFFQLPSLPKETEQSTTDSSDVTTAPVCISVYPYLMGTTVFGLENGTAGSSLSTLNAPWGITINSDNSMLIADNTNNRVLYVSTNATTGKKVAPSSGSLYSRRAYFDSSYLNLYVIDCDRCQMTRYYNGSLTKSILFSPSCGANLTQFGKSGSFTLDSNGNGTQHLFKPQDIVLDESEGVYYVADTFNHRVLRFSFGSTNGTIVAGGNSAGIGPTQLNGPCGIYLSKKNQTLYIADTTNNRIVRWCLGCSEGITIAGACDGTAGNSPFLLKSPTTVTMDNDEKYLYVADRSNNRIQRFEIA
ncbi:hypothetical protein I4U23_004376 [Adineta vaga]|nr:hypothetical protein I4U23_004376 [Adineta vaga]